MLRPPLRMAFAVGLSGAALAAFLVDHRLRTMSDARRDAYVGLWARALLKTLRVDLVTAPSSPAVGSVSGRTASPPADGARPRLVVSNHRGVLDIPIMLHLFGGHLLSRGDMADWPLIGTMARHAGTLFVDREDPSSGAKAVFTIREKLRQGRSITVFPEGTTFPGD